MNTRIMTAYLQKKIRLRIVEDDKLAAEYFSNELLGIHDEKINNKFWSKVYGKDKKNSKRYRNFSIHS